MSTPKWELLEVWTLAEWWHGTRTGRFLSEDPIGLAGGINPYVFGGSDAVNGSDPTGLYLYRLPRFWQDGAEARALDMIDATSPYSGMFPFMGDGGSGGVGGDGGGSSTAPTREVSACVGASLDAVFSAASDVLFLTGVGAAYRLSKGIVKMAALFRRAGNKAAYRAGQTADRMLATRAAHFGRVDMIGQTGRAGVVNAGMSGVVGGVLEDPEVAAHMVAAFIPVVGSIDSAWTAVACWIGR